MENTFAPAPAQSIRVSNKWAAHALTFLMVFGPGLIVMEAELSRRMSRLARNTGHIFCGCCCCCCQFAISSRRWSSGSGLLQGRGMRQ
jgi:hypothetical protein